MVSIRIQESREFVNLSLRLSRMAHTFWNSSNLGIAFLVSLVLYVFDRVVFFL
jgi:hypothetical protein